MSWRRCGWSRPTRSPSSSTLAGESRGQSGADPDAGQELHNQYIVDLTKDAAKTARLGLSRDRLLDAIFTADTMPRLIHQWTERPGTLDQSDLARFFRRPDVEQTCRKVVVACAKAGFVVRDSKIPTVVSLSGRAADAVGAPVRRELGDLRRRMEQADHVARSLFRDRHVLPPAPQHGRRTPRLAAGGRILVAAR